MPLLPKLSLEVCKLGQTFAKTFLDLITVDTRWILDEADQDLLLEQPNDQSEAKHGQKSHDSNDYGPSHAHVPNPDLLVLPCDIGRLSCLHKGHILIEDFDLVQLQSKFVGVLSAERTVNDFWLGKLVIDSLFVLVLSHLDLNLVGFGELMFLKEVGSLL